MSLEPFLYKGIAYESEIEASGPSKDVEATVESLKQNR
jgi:hypothetical protein